MEAVCRHCGRNKVNRPRGLCWTCYYQPGIRDGYESTSKFARRGLPDFNGRHRPAPEPTAAMPKSAGKLAVLEERALAGVSLWHPRDAEFNWRRETPDTPALEISEDGDMSESETPDTLTNRERGERIRLTIKALGPDCKLEQVNNHLKEEGLSCCNVTFLKYKGLMFGRNAVKPHPPVVEDGAADRPASVPQPVEPEPAPPRHEGTVRQDGTTFAQKNGRPSYGIGRKQAATPPTPAAQPAASIDDVLEGVHLLGMAMAKLGGRENTLKALNTLNVWSDAR